MTEPWMVHSLCRTTDSSHTRVPLSKTSLQRYNSNR